MLYHYEVGWRAASSTPLTCFYTNYSTWALYSYLEREREQMRLIDSLIFIGIGKCLNVSMTGKVKSRTLYVYIYIIQRCFQGSLVKCKMCLSSKNGDTCDSFYLICPFLHCLNFNNENIYI